MAGVFQLLIYCTVGTVIEVWNDRTVNAIYEVPWYKLTKERAMEFLFMYKKAQLLSLLSIAGIAPLSVATAKEVGLLFFKLSKEKKLMLFLLL